MNVVAIGLGSNEGDRQLQLSLARELIYQHFDAVQCVSSIYETKAWGVIDQPDFLNQVLCFNCSLSINELHPMISAIETRLGKRSKGHWSQRNIDVDCLYYGDQVVCSPDWKVPHPYLHRRRFVLIPLCDITPDWHHPIFQLSVVEMLAMCDDQSEVHICK